MVAKGTNGTDVALRTGAAMAGGYALAAAATAALARTLPMSRAEAVLTATLTVLLLVLPVAVMACFRVRSGGRAWLWMLSATLVCAAIAAMRGAPA